MAEKKKAGSLAKKAGAVAGLAKNKVKKLSDSDKKSSGAGKKDKVLAFFQTKAGLAVGTLIALALIIFAVFTAGIYKFGWSDDATLALARVVPYPAIFVNGHVVSYAKYEDYQKAYMTYVKEFYIKEQQKMDVNSADAKKILADAQSRVQDILVRNAVIENEAKKRHIKYTRKDIDDSFNDFVKRTGGDQEVAKNLKKYYGLTVERFKQEFYVDTFLSGKLQNDIQNDKSLNADAKKKAEDVLAKVKAGQDFAELAKKYSDDSTASKGGDLGFVKKGTLVPEFEDALWKLKNPGDVSGLVKTVYGYHIIKLTAINGDERQASHILIKTMDYDSWLNDQVKKAKVSYWVKEFKSNNPTSQPTSGK